MARLRYFTLIPFLILLLRGADPVHAQAAAPEFPVSTSAEVTFGQGLAFEIETEPGTPLAHVSLLVDAPGWPGALTHDFTPADAPQMGSGERFTLSHQILISEAALAPFSTISYYWLIEGVDGTQWQTEREELVYKDDRFQWRRLADQGVEVYWTDADTSLGQAALEIVQESLPRIQEMIPTNPPLPLRVYLYPSAADLRSALDATETPWVGGHADPALGAIFVTAVNPRTAPLDLQRSLPHELAHLLLYQLYPEKYDLLPFWLNEGLSTSFEQTPNPNYDLLLEEAVAAQTAIPLSDLCRPTLRDEFDPALAYAQSASAVSYLRSTYGDAALRGVLAVQLQNIDERRQRLNCDTPLLEAFGFTLEGLNQRWLEDRAPRTWWQTTREEYLIWIFLLVLGFVAATFLVVGTQRRGAKKRAARQT